MASTRAKGSTKAPRVTEDLSSTLAEALNKKFKESQVAFLLEREESPTDLDDFVSTGSVLVNIAATNRPDGGFPVGRISEITGLEGTGKSLMAMHALADTQRQGGVAVLIDTETAVDENFLRTIGVDVSKLVYCPVDTIEQVFELIEFMIEEIRSKDASTEKRLLTIVVDSVAAASTRIEQESGFDKDGYATAKAIIISKSLRKITNMIGRERVCLIFTNQLREKMNVMAFADKYTTPGGKALPFHASLRIRLASKGKLDQTRSGIKHVIGMSTVIEIKKTRMAPPHRKVEVPLYFDSGLDDYASWLDHLVKYKVISKAGKTCTYKDLKFQVDDWRSMLEDSDFRQQIINELVHTLVLDRVTPESVVLSNVEVSDED